MIPCRDTKGQEEAAFLLLLTKCILITLCILITVCILSTAHTGRHLFSHNQITRHFCNLFSIYVF